MNIRRAVFIAVVVLAIAALAVPLVGMSTHASSVGGSVRPAIAPMAAPAPAPAVRGQEVVKLANGQEVVRESGQQSEAPGKISAETWSALGIPRTSDPAAAANKIQKRLLKGGSTGDVSIQSGQPQVLSGRSATSAALMTNVGGRDNQFSEVTLIADWDGREDCVADREAKVDDFSGVEPDIDFVLTRTAISEHTIANGFNESVYYYGDSVGNVWVGVDTSGDARADVFTQINLPTVLNAFGTLNSDDQITITGLAVNPVADLTSFSNVNGAFASFAGLTGEILYVTYTDTESGLRLAANNTPVRSGLLAFPVADIVSAAAAPPGILSGAGFPVQVGGAFGVAFSVFSNIAGCAVDDNGSVYFQQVDLVGFTGANITEIRSTDSATNQDRSLATSGFFTITTLNPTNGQYGIASGPANQVNTATNYSGTSTLFGNIVALATGGCNVVYAAVSRSFVATDSFEDRLTEGLFSAPSAFTAGTPSMVISFADCAGAFDVCSGVTALANVGGTLPAANGIADVAQSGLALSAGVNNFRVFVLGNGPDIRPGAGTSAIVTNSTLKVDMQIDYQVHAGIAVSEEGTVYVISGGAPAGPGKNPSPMVGEVLCFPDSCPADRRADFIDLRGNGLPNPPASGGNTGDGDSDRFDHIFYQAPIDAVTLTPGGLAGLSRGFLRYTNRLAPNAIGTGVTLGQTGGKRVLGDDDSTEANVIFEMLDPGHQVAGGDDQNPPFRGDDDNGAGTPSLAGPLSGGFEFVFGGPVTTPNCVWNGFFWNSNGNITFGVGDSANIANVLTFRSGSPKIAPAWCDLNPASRVQGFNGTFPVMALGFANINAFKIRWINVPEFGQEACVGAQNGLTNTFSITLYDDGTGIDENANQPLNPANPIGNNAVPFDLQEGPTDLVWTREPNTQQLVGCSSRPNGSGFIVFDYCRMDLLGTDADPVITGYSIGGLSPLNPPGLCEINMSKSAAAADQNPFAVLADSNNETANICSNCCIGEGTEPTLFELFNEGSGASTGSGGEITFAKPDFDLRFEGNDPLLCTSARQKDLNRGRVCLFGIGCAPPTNPTCQQVVAGAFTTPAAPAGFAASAGLVNAICTVQLNALGCGFFPNEVTTVCQGFEAETGVPLQRPGKTVTTAQALACDTNGDGIAEATIALGSVTPVSCNLVRGTLNVLSSLPGTAFPTACCGGPATLTTTTTFTTGDNNAFGAFTRTSVCSLNLGTRAPVVFSVTPSNGDCRTTDQDLIITGACFQFNTFNASGGAVVGTVTSVFAQDVANPANIIQAKTFQIVNPGVIDAHFSFGSANNGKTFLIFVTGTGGTSRNLVGTPGNACNDGNEQGIRVTFKCDTPGTPGSGQTPDLATVTKCQLVRDDAGIFSVDVFGTNIKQGASVTVGGQVPKKVKFVDLDTTGNAFTRISIKKKVCKLLTGSAAIVITNPGQTQGSAPFNCQERCPTN